MRDNETIETALRTAMTGHLVLSTLHTNDAASTVYRLIDMGVKPFMIASSLRGILAQRLVRKVCENCATSTVLTEPQKALVSTTLGEPAESFDFKHGTGCLRCNESGYSGRTVISEYIEIDATLMESIQNGDQQHFIQQASLQPGYLSINQSVFRLAAKGITSMNEAMRISFGIG